MIYVDHLIAGDGSEMFVLVDLADVGKYVAQIASDPWTLNKRVFAHAEVLGMNEIRDTMPEASGETPTKNYISEAELDEVIKAARKQLDETCKPPMHTNNITDIANYQHEYADYLGYVDVDFWKMFSDFARGKSIAEFFRYILENELFDQSG
ncbi:hypothetical protein ACHAPT_012351 [Fusarium lateritium]